MRRRVCGAKAYACVHASLCSNIGSSRPRHAALVSACLRAPPRPPRYSQKAHHGGSPASPPPTVRARAPCSVFFLSVFWRALAPARRHVGGARAAPRLGAPRIRAPALAATCPVGTPIALNRGSALPTSARCCQARWHARTCASALVRVLLPRPAAVGHAASPARRRVHPTQCAEGLAPARFSRTGHTALEDGRFVAIRRRVKVHEPVKLSNKLNVV